MNKNAEEDKERILQVANQYKDQFGQESVPVINNSVKAGFYKYLKINNQLNVIVVVMGCVNQVWYNNQTRVSRDS